MRRWLGVVIAGFAVVAAFGQRMWAGELIPVGVARVDITPAYPTRLVGYESRREESNGVASRLAVTALALGANAAPGPAVLVTVDNCGVGRDVVESVAARLAAQTGLRRERFVVCSTHTHCAPGLAGTLDFIYGGGLKTDERERIKRYTGEVATAIEKAALAALANRTPATLALGRGQADFAANRRLLARGKWQGFGVNPAGPTDHSLPVIRAVGSDGKVKAIICNYACHCTTLGGEFNQICADWAGYARDELERLYPGAKALVTIGCGADANPQPRRGLDDAKAHGLALARSVDRVLHSAMRPLAGAVSARLKQLELPLEIPPSQAQLELKSAKPGAEGAFARSLIERLDRGEPIPRTIPYTIAVWSFQDQLAMVFLAGEVVVDYALRLGWEIGPERLWISAYANDVPCYIPSRRVLSEGGYEADFSMIYYGRPARFTPEVEDAIIDSVHELLPGSFAASAR